MFQLAWPDLAGTGNDSGLWSTDLKVSFEDYLSRQVVVIQAKYRNMLS